MNKIILHHRYWFLPVAIWTSVVLASLAWNYSVIERQVVELSASQGREIFRLMEAVRLWNARHGGLFVLQSEDTPPNPYLQGVEKEAQTVDGRRLTLVNPAYMTRLVADTFFELTQVRVRIVSLKPINPGNAADPWEEEALRTLEKGDKERAEVVRGEGRSVARYIAPLLTTPACLECHARHGYKVGDVRGGISVSFPTAPLEGSLHLQKRNALLVHLVGWLLVTLLTLFALHRSRRQMLELARGKDALEAEVGERTAELRREVAERHQAERRLRLLVDASGNGIFGLAANGECTFVNPVALQLLGAKDAGHFLGRPILEMITPVENQLQRLQEALRQGRSLHSDEFALERVDGDTFQADLRLDPIDSDGAAGAVVNFSDITQRKAMEANIWHQANYDTLTGLANRNLFADRLERAISQAGRSEETIALLFIDLDGFKAVNDLHGHAAGDQVLRQTALRLEENIRESDMAARQAGDEFLVILRNLDSGERAGQVASKLIEALARPIRVGSDEVRVSASVGIAFYPADAGTPDDLVKCADHAMYQAKEAGKHTWRYYGRAPQST